MSPALLRGLICPVNLRGRGLHKMAQAVLTLSASRNRLSAAAASRDVRWQILAVRCCSGHTTFRQQTNLTGTQEEEEEDRTRKLLSPYSATPPNQTDLSSVSPNNFLLPSHYQRHQSDLLEAKLYECQSANDALEVYRRHKEVMDTRHCLALTRRLNDLVSSGDVDSAHLLQNDDFKALCGELFIQCRRMELEEHVALLKYVCRLGLPSHSKLTQAILQMLKNQINDLSIKQLIFLEFLLKKMPLTPLSDALITAIPILLSNALTSSSLTDLSFSDISQAFSICCQGKVEGTGILLKEIYHRGSVKSVTIGMSLVWTLTQMSNPRVLSRLLTADELLTRDVIMKESLETIAKETDALTHQQIESTLTKISDSHKRGDRSCYNERFLQAVASHSCRSSANFESVAHTLRKMVKMNYLSDELIRYIVQLVLSKPKDVPEARAGMLPLLSALGATTSLPHEDLLKALDIIMTHKSLRLDTEEYYKKPLLVMAVDLLSAGYIHPPLMDILTSSDTLNMFMSKYPKEDINHKRLLMIGQALSEVFQSTYRVPEAFLEPVRKAMAGFPPCRSSLRAMLLQILQDSSCLFSGVLTEGGSYIDHLLALDPEGVPIKLKTAEPPLLRNPSITTLDVPAEATKIAILDIGSSTVFRPSNMLRGQQRLRQITLEAGGFKVLPMLQSVIFQHREEEKFLYVKRELSSASVVLS